MTKSVVVMPIWWRLKKKFRRRWSGLRGRSHSWTRERTWDESGQKRSKFIHD